MSRALSSNMTAAIFAQYTDKLPLFLIKIDHADFPTPVYLCNDRADLVSNGITYNSYGFAMKLPAEDTEQPQIQTQIKICNIDLQVIAALDALATEPTITVMIALWDTPDTIEYGPANFLLNGYDYDGKEILGSISYEMILSEPIPGDSFTPGDYPSVLTQ